MKYKSIQLNDEELENVNGGQCVGQDWDVVSIMKCDVCGAEANAVGGIERRCTKEGCPGIMHFDREVSTL